MTEDAADYPIVIVGSGIAGLTAAIYAGRAGNDPLVVRGDEPGGQLTLTTDVANYPGFPDGISGPALVQDMEAQAEQFGAEFEHAIVETVSKTETGVFELTFANEDSVTAEALIAASGAQARTLGIPGEDDLMGFGVSTCATCDGAFFQGEDMVVIGGGDAACEEASFLTKFADTVYLVHRRDEFRAEEYWQDEVQSHVDDGDIELVLNAEVTEIHGSEEDGIEGVELVKHPDGHPKDRLDESETTRETLDVGAVFVAIGHEPSSEYLADLGVACNEDGYVETKTTDGAGQTETNVDGVFAAGDVVDYHYQQAVTAAGMGCKAAMDADEYLSD